MYKCHVAWLVVSLLITWFSETSKAWPCKTAISALKEARRSEDWSSFWQQCSCFCWSCQLCQTLRKEGDPDVKVPGEGVVILSLSLLTLWMPRTHVYYLHIHIYIYTFPKNMIQRPLIYIYVQKMQFGDHGCPHKCIFYFTWSFAGFYCGHWKELFFPSFFNNTTTHERPDKRKICFHEDVFIHPW